MDNQNKQPRMDGEELNGQTMRIPEVPPTEELPVTELPDIFEEILSEEVLSEPAEPETTEDVARQISEAVAAETGENDYFGEAEEENEDDWLDELLPEQELPQELEADELAVADAGLMHPEDVELENIIRQTNEEASQTDATQMFVPVDPDTLPEEDEEAEGDEEAEADEEDESPQRKRRPKWKKGYGLLGIPHILATGVWLAIILAIGLYLGRMIWLCAVDVLALGKEPKRVTVVITEEDTVETISEKLKKSGMIRYPKLFQTFADLTEKGKEIEPGTYTFNIKLGEDPTYQGIAYDYNALIMSMQHYGGAQDSVEVLFPEGYNCAQIFALLEEKGVCTVAELEEYAANGELDSYWFLEGVERGHKYCLEGYLCADTYQFYIDDEPKRVLEKLLDEFDDRFTERLEQKFTEVNQMLANKMAANGYSQEVIDASQMTLHDIVVLASIIEKETASNVESFDFALVFYNRLADPDDYPYLNCKSTMKYAEEYYYKGQLHTTAAKEECEFNTFTQAGLPEKPICNPSLNSMAAALNPKDGSDGNYFYFVYDKDAGSHRFAETEYRYNAILEELGLNDG